MQPFFINSPNNLIPENPTTEILKQNNAVEYHRTLANYKPTPLIELNNLARKFGVGNIYVKDESYRLGLNAFKGLGASFAIHQVLKRKPNVKVFCTATDGNHGRAVAWASKIENKKAVIFVPGDTSQNRIDAISKEGAEVIQLNKNYDETCIHADKISKRNNWELIQDTAWDNYTTIPAEIMAGYLTQFKEIENKLHTLPQPKIDLVFLQAGVGSWAGAAVWYYLNRYTHHRPKIVIVEPNECAGILESFQANQRVTPSGNFETIMAGLNCGIPSLTAWEIIKNGADAAIKIPDQFAKTAMQELYYSTEDDETIISGESGAAGVAGFIALMCDPAYLALKNYLNISKDTNILFYSTEGATDIDRFNSIVVKVS